MSEEDPQINTEGIDNLMATPSYDMIKEVCVMLIDHDQNFIAVMVDLLKSYKYKVRTADMASAGISMLTKGKEKIDVMIININSPDLLSFHLLAQAVALDIISICICDEHNAHLEKKALDNGAYLSLQKPLHEEIVKCLWKFVLREKVQKEKAKKGLKENRDRMNNIDDTGNINIVGDNEEQSRKKNNVPTSTEKKINNIHKAANDVILNEKYKPKRKRGRKATNQGESQNNANKTVTRKCYTVWTMDLHKKFMEAVDQLGDGRCCPVEILEVMNVPGLTRLQVASHLQKCRNNNWRAPKERKSTRQLSGQLGSSGYFIQRNRQRKFGIMPHLQTNVISLQQQQQQQRNQQIQSSPMILLPPHNNIYSIGESSTQQQVCHPQLQVDPQYLISLDNPVLSPAENNDSSALQRQHEPLVGMLGSQESITGSTYYKSGMELNDGDLHAQNNYDWKVEAYSMMFDTDVENVTVNDLGVENANFQQYICEPNISHPNNIITTSHVSYTEGNDSYERENYDPYLDFIDIDSLFENHESPSSNLPNGHDSEFDQVFCDD